MGTSKGFFKAQTWRSVCLMGLVSTSTTWAGWDILSFPATDPSERIIDLTFTDLMHGWGLVSDGFNSRVVRTTNGGQSWEPLYSAGYSENDRSMLQFVSSNIGYYAPNDTFDDELLLRSIDGGATFNPVTNPFGSDFFPGSVASVFFFDELNGWAAGDFGDGMFSKTVNGGTSWELHAAPRAFDANDIFFINPMRGWAVGGNSSATDGVIQYTQDGGNHWQVSGTRTQERLTAIRFANALTGWAVGENGNIHISTNGGRSWYPQSSGTGGNLTDVEVIDENIVLVATDDYTSPGVVFLTTNGGRSWRRQGLPMSVEAKALARISDTLWVGGSTSETDPNSIFLFRQTIDPANLPGIVFDHLPGGTVGVPYEFPLTAIDGTPPYEWSLVGDGNGLSVNPQTGLISGVPILVGETGLVIELTDVNTNRDERIIRIPVIDTPLSFSSSVIPSVTHRTTFRFPLNLQGGHKPYHFRLLGANPPSGVSVDSQGVLSGTPFETGTFDFTIEVVDSGSLPQRATADFSLPVNPLLAEKWEIQHAHNRITNIHFFNESRGLATTWSGLVLDTDTGGRAWSKEPLVDDVLIDMDCVGNECWILVPGGRVFHSTNQGITWQETASIGGVSLIGIEFFDSQHGWAFGNGIYYTEDGGQSWHEAATPAGSNYYGLDFKDLMNGFAGGGGASSYFAKSTDGGRTWTPEVIPGFASKGQPGPRNTPAVDLKVDPPIGGVHEKGVGLEFVILGVYFLNAQEGWVGTNIIDQDTLETRLFHTPDGGQTWETQGALGLGTTQVVQFLPDGETGWVGGLNGGSFRKTTDGGDFWSIVAGFEGDMQLFDFQFLDANTGWICANLVGRIGGNGALDMEGSIWKTSDGGESWTLQYGWPQGYDEFTSYPPDLLITGPDFVDISFPTEKVGYALGRRAYGGTESFLYRTDSGGAFWTRHGKVPFYFHRIEFPNEWHGFGLSEDGSQPIQETVDGGLTWFPRHDIGPDGTLSATESASGLGFTGLWSDVFFADDLHGWIVRDRGTFGANKRNVLRTTDGGKDWESFHLALRSGSHRIVFADPMNGWLMGQSGSIEHSVNGGETWTIQLTPANPFPLFADAHFIDEMIGFAAGTAGIIAETTTGGDTWIRRQQDPEMDFLGTSFISCLKGWMVGATGFEGVNPLLLETTNGSFDSFSQVDIELVNHSLTNIESPDSVNAWVFGRYGVGLKYSAPTSSIRITTEALPSGRDGAVYSFQLENEYGTGPFSWQLCGGRLPQGLMLAPNGTLSGTPTEAGSFRITPAVFDSSGETAGRRLLLQIEPATSPTIQTLTLPSGSVGAPYQASLEATGTVDPYEWTVASGELPAGIILLPYGLLSGVPTLPGAFPITLRVVDGQTPNGSAGRDYLLTISGSFAGQPSNPCDQLPLYCIARSWQQSGSELNGDFNGSGKVDVFDVLEVLEGH